MYTKDGMIRPLYRRATDAVVTIAEDFYPQLMIFLNKNVQNHKILTHMKKNNDLYCCLPPKVCQSERIIRLELPQGPELNM